MGQKHTLTELNNLSRKELITIVLTMQGQLNTKIASLAYIQKELKKTADTRKAVPLCKQGALK